MTGAATANNETVERLRDRIRKLQAAPREYVASLRTGIAPFDRLFPGEGLPMGSAIELWGEAASGRLSLALRAVAAAGRSGRLSAYVDGPKELYPPAAAALGVDLSRLLIVRPKAPGQLAWTAVQLCRSGAFSCVVLDLTHTGVRLSPAECKKLKDAAFRGGTLLLLVTPTDAPAEGLVRLSTRAEGLEGLSIEVLRGNRGAGQRTLLPWNLLYGKAAPGPCASLRATAIHAAPAETRFLRSPPREPYGLCASRPGRDGRLPPLQSTLGLSS
jgi:recombination protein RecA